MCLREREFQNNLVKTVRLLLFCTINTESATTNCDSENNDQDKTSKPSFKE